MTPNSPANNVDNNHWPTIESRHTVWRENDRMRERRQGAVTRIPEK